MQEGALSKLMIVSLGEQLSSALICTWLLVKFLCSSSPSPQDGGAEERLRVADNALPADAAAAAHQALPRARHQSVQPMHLHKPHEGEGGGDENLLVR